MKNALSIGIAVVALLLSLVTFVTVKKNEKRVEQVRQWQLASKPLGEGIEKYSFSTPIDAYRSQLQMNLNNDILASMQFESAVSERKIREKLATLSVEKEREHEGKKLLFIEYKETGVPKRKVVALEKDAESGYWYIVHVSTYFLKDSNSALAAEMTAWEESK